MADIQKVINAWKMFRNSNPYQLCDGREFRAISEPEYCMGQMIADTIELLKEQDRIITSLKADLQETLKVVSEQSNVIRCKDCINRGNPKKCLVAYIGDVKSVPYFYVDNNGEFYCADGKYADT